MKKFLFLLLILAAVFLSAQEMAEMDALLDTKEVTFSQAARFILAAAGTLEENCTPAEAYAHAQDQNWVSAKSTPDKTAGLGEISFLLIKSFDLKGGIFYTLFPGPRYSYRELKSLGLLGQWDDPDLPVSGAELIDLIDKINSRSR
jgi:hypothetical protein